MHVSVSDNNFMCVLFMYGPVSMSVRPSVHKKFSDLNEIWCAGSGRWVMHDDMPYDPIQGQWLNVKVTEVRKLRKWRISKSISSAGMHVIKRLTVNYDTPRQYVNFWHSYPTSRDLKNLLFHLWQRNFASYQESIGIYGAYYIIVRRIQYRRRHRRDFDS